MTKKKPELDPKIIEMVAAISHEAMREYRSFNGISEQNTAKFNPQPWEFIDPHQKAAAVSRADELAKKPKTKSRDKNEGLVFDTVAKALLAELS